MIDYKILMHTLPFVGLIGYLFFWLPEWVELIIEQKKKDPDKHNFMKRGFITITIIFFILDIFFIK